LKFYYGKAHVKLITVSPSGSKYLWSVTDLSGKVLESGTEADENEARNKAVRGCRNGIN
jgi:hypothetical protein